MKIGTELLLLIQKNGLLDRGYSLPYSWAVGQTVGSIFSQATDPAKVFHKRSFRYSPGHCPPSVKQPKNMALDGMPRQSALSHLWDIFFCFFKSVSMEMPVI